MINVSEAFKAAFSGPVDRTLMKLEVNFGGAIGWVDITSYIESIGGDLEEVNFEGGTSANTLNLTLINDDGRFSRKNTAGPYYGYLTPNKPLRFSLFYGGESVRQFTGFSGPWKTSARSRTCSMTAFDMAGILAAQDIIPETVFNAAAPATGYFLTRIIERAAWLSGIRWDKVSTKSDVGGNAFASSTQLNPDGSSIVISVNKSPGAIVSTYTQNIGGADVAVMTLDLVDLLIPIAILNGKALSVLAKLADVAGGRIYFDAQGQMIFRSRMYRNDTTLTSVATFNVSNLDDCVVDSNYGGGSDQAPLINRAVVTSKPYIFSTDANGNMIEEDVVFGGNTFGKNQFNAGETYPTASDPDLFLTLPDGYRMVRTTGPTYPTASNIFMKSADVADQTKELNGIGVQSVAFFDDAMKLVFKNNGAGVEVIKSLTLRVKLMKPVQGCESEQKNDTSIGLYGQKDFDLSNNFIPTAKACRQRAAWAVEDGRNIKDILSLPVMYGLPWLEIGDKITVSETLSKSVPISEDFMIKRISWSWTVAGIAFAITACTPSPSFSVGSLPAAVTNVLTRNQNENGVVASAMPPQIVDGAKSMVGLNNIPSMSTFVASTRKITAFTPALASSYKVFFDGSDIFVTQQNTGTGGFGRVYKINPMTGAQVAARQVLNIGGQTHSIAMGGGNLFVTDSATWKVLVVPRASFDTTEFTLKASLTIEPGAVLVAGGKLYVLTASASGSFLYQWNDLSTTRQDAPNGNYKYSDYYEFPNEVVFDGRYIWIPRYNFGSIARFDTQTNTMTSASLTLDAGEFPNGITHDGQGLWIGLGNGKVIRYTISQSGALVRDKSITLPSGVWAVAFDGMYIWAGRTGFVTQISPSLAVLGHYPISGDSIGIAFDGTAIWSSGFDNSISRVPRLVANRQF